ncbi:MULTISPECIES: hypothetical protein [unclassified Aureimonas]|uniref:hypothetical protein n=1 Tax=unclassified Aureimonas TaxID=2615206 RepID=UPI0006F8C20B|nr:MULTISPECIES: hypothetical protein [unclassified Aureimonas]KQT62593.1 hypothetical protein ASG62_23045 [Aureimonas sp. Leaf427]KQT73182.1 hypothetical protein ASG54_17990 [Aureimonas sp. Leaf460]
MITVSAEIRWFGRDQPPTGLDAFFDVDQALVRIEEPRDDGYLTPDPAWHEVGIKIRDEMLEAKGPVDMGRSIHLPSIGSVLARGWSKWSMKPDLGDRKNHFTAEFLRSGPTAFVRKVRQLRRYVPNWEGQVPSGASPVSNADPSSAPIRICSVELTHVTLRRDAEEPQVGWTFGFEAIGDYLDDAYAILSTTALAVVEQQDRDTLAVLSKSDFRSYPAWLSVGPLLADEELRP